MPECSSPLREELKAYLDGELNPLQRQAVARHLERCPHCQAELATLRQLGQALATLPAPAPLPPALHARILTQLTDHTAPVPVRLPFWRRPGPLTAAGSLLATACAFWIWVRVAPKPAPSSTVVAMAEKTDAAAKEATISAPGAAAAPSARPQKSVAQEKAKARAAVALLGAAPRRKNDQDEAGRNASQETVSTPGGEKADAAPPLPAVVRVPARPHTPLVTTPPADIAPTTAGGASSADSLQGMVPNRASRGGFGGRGGFSGNRGAALANRPELAPAPSRVAPPVVVPSLTLTVAAGKAEQTLHELRGVATALGLTELPAPTDSPAPPATERRLVLLVPPEKHRALREQLETRGTLTEAERKDTKKEVSPSVLITIREEISAPTTKKGN